MTKPSEIAAALHAAADAVAEIPDTTASELEKATGMGPASPEFAQAVVQFRAAGGNIEQLRILTRAAARGCLFAEDLALLAEHGITPGRL